MAFANFDKNFIASDPKTLCRLLGVNREIENWLYTLEPEKLQHHNLLYYLIKTITAKAQISEDNGSLCESLMNLGFTTERAEAIANTIPVDLINMQKPLYWAERYLENAFSYHLLLSEATRYIYQESKINEWFQVAISTEERDEPYDDIPTYSIDMINVDKKSPDTELLEDRLRSEEDNESVLLYHSTTHEGAKSILEYGIILSKGKDGQDFSSGDGFYLFENFENSKRWCRVGCGDHQAVVVFKVEPAIFKNDINGLDLTEERIQWEQIIQFCRSEYSGNNKIRKQVDGASFIRGNMCANLHDLKSGSFGREDNIQICIRQKEFATQFGSLRNIRCVIFY